MDAWRGGREGEVKGQRGGGKRARARGVGGGSMYEVLTYAGVCCGVC